MQSLEQTAREILTLLQGVHQGAGFQDSKFFVLILKVFIQFIDLSFKELIYIQKTYQICIIYSEKCLSCFMVSKNW